MVVVIDSSIPRRVARLQPVWRKCMTTTIRPVSTMVLIGLSETNTIGYYSSVCAYALGVVGSQGYPACCPWLSWGGQAYSRAWRASVSLSGMGCRTREG